VKTGDRPVVALDANIILRFLVQDGGELAEKATRIMAAVEDGEIEAVCDPVILAEVVWVLSSYYGQEPSKVSEVMRTLIKAEGIRLAEKDRYARALEIFAAGAIHFGDACACAAALEVAGGRLLSFDRKLARVSGITRAEAV
jgi:predicted nucleic-acid-binding protein